MPKNKPVPPASSIRWSIQNANGETAATLPPQEPLKVEIHRTVIELLAALLVEDLGSRKVAP